MTKRGILLLVVILLPAVSIVTQAQSGNKTINSFFASNPEYHLLSLTDIPDMKSDQEYVDQFSPIVRGDANGDGRSDLAAIVVQKHNGKSLFSLICFHGLKTGYKVSPFWVIKDEESPILNTRMLTNPPQLAAWLCFHCDDAAVFSWNGNKYVEAAVTNSEEEEETPTGATIVIETPSGGVSVRDFYKGAEDAGSDGYVTLRDDSYQIAYSGPSRGNIFWIHLPLFPPAKLTGAWDFERKKAESDFLKLLQISQQDACKLKVDVGFAGIHNELAEIYAGRNFGLSFCPDSEPIPPLPLAKPKTRKRRR